MKEIVAKEITYIVAQLIGGIWQVQWKDRRGNKCQRTFGTQKAAGDWIAAQLDPPRPEAQS